MKDGFPVLRAGVTLRSRSDRSLAFLVITAGAATHPPTHDGVPLCPGPPPPCSEAATGGGRSLRAGVLYADHPSGLILRCTSAGDGVLAYDGRELSGLQIPASDPTAGDRDRPSVSCQHPAP